MLKIGSLCTGYGGLDLAVEAHFQAKTVWCAEFDKYASQVIKAHFDMPNYGDIKAINWAEVEPIDILTAGYPCQPFSHAGYRKGTDDARHIFPYILEAISVLRPQWVILENVRGHLSLGLKDVLQGLAEQGYDAKWQVIRASEVGAPHQRARVFIIAYANSSGSQRRNETVLQKRQIDGRYNNQGIIADTNGNARKEPRRDDRGISSQGKEILNGSDRQVNGSSNTDVSYTDNQYQPHNGQVQKLGRRFIARCEMHLQEPPNALDQDGKLNAEFVEYMMGLPVGWITNVGLSRAQQLKILGNGVVPQQAEYALELLTSDWGKDVE
jgi:DNA (cytosine-5)-methyltransferase 1